MTEVEKKHFEMLQLSIKVRDYVFNKFFDIESMEMLDEKIEVMKQIIDGRPIDEIKNYYKVLELYPKDDTILWD